MKFGFLVKKDKKKFFRAGVLFCIWIILMFTIGFSIQQSSEESRKENPDIQETIDRTGGDIPDEQKTPEQKKATEEQRKLNVVTTEGDLNSLADSLQLSKNWDLIGEVKEKGIPVLRPYFPKGQDASRWKESIVFRDFVNVKIKNPTPVAYNIYYEWLKGLLPDLQMTNQEDDTGVNFSGHSKGGNVYIVGKVFEGQLESTVFIIQYVLRESGTDDSATSGESRERAMSEVH